MEAGGSRQKSCTLSMGTHDASITRLSERFYLTQLAVPVLPFLSGEPWTFCPSCHVTLINPQTHFQMSLVNVACFCTIYFHPITSRTRRTALPLHALIRSCLSASSPWAEPEFHCFQSNEITANLKVSSKNTEPAGKGPASTKEEADYCKRD